MRKIVDPIEIKDIYRLLYNRDTLLSDADKKVVSRVYPIIAGLGALLAVGGVFVLLATYQILPTAPNFFSVLGTKSLMIGSAAIFSGSLPIVIYMVKRWKVMRENLPLRKAAEKQLIEDINHLMISDFCRGCTCAYGEMIYLKDPSKIKKYVTIAGGFVNPRLGYLDPQIWRTWFGEKPDNGCLCESEDDEYDKCNGTFATLQDLRQRKSQQN